MLSSDSVSMCPGRPEMLCDHFRTCCFVSFNRFALIMLETDWERVVDKSCSIDAVVERSERRI